VSSQKEQAEAQDQRALNDPTLLPGDIVATSKGFGPNKGARHKAQNPIW
jgi:hypothetical protein